MYIDKDLDVVIMGDKTMKCYCVNNERFIMTRWETSKKKHTTNVDFEKKQDKKKMAYTHCYTNK